MSTSSAINFSNMSTGTNGTYDKNGLSSSTTGDGDYASDPASGGLSSFFVSDYKKHDDLKQMLDSAKDGPKLEAMKRIIGMIAKGRDASELFPAVVKNVVSKNIEVKKLVYVYLVRYAEQQQDLALLSISTFQRALKDPNQLIRASALRVLSSIRVVMIVPIVMLAIKDSAADMSPYVRKTAAHAIPKLYSLDPDQKEELITVIEKLLADKSTLVVGSTVMAFEEVCPERIDLIHKIYRKLCNLLVDIDEWGQVIIVNMLTRYGRTQFVNPNKNDINDSTKIENSNFDNSDLSSCEEVGVEDEKSTILDQDHRLLLRNAKPLFQSRNAAVVMSVAQLYHHLAPKSEVNVISKALIRLLRSHREVQSVVLNSIASISIARKSMFEPYLKSFFVRSNDPTHIKLLKLDILTNLANETSISTILREVQTYISSTDKQFVAAAIQAIGRCASNIKEVTETCLSGLVSMLSSRDEAVVAESVVVIKKLLQNQPEAHCDIIRHMARLMDSIAVPQARASILWLLGEYSQLVSTIAPDVLRKVAKTYVTEEDIVKLQIMNLAVKLFLTNPAQTTLLCQYVLKQAKYDQNYDIRDRSRFLNNLLFPPEQFKDSILSKHATDIFLAEKPAPLLQSNFVDREEYQMGSLSHYINCRAVGYQDLPQFPESPTDSSVRCVAVPEEQEKPVKQKTEKTTSNKKKTFYSDSENNSDDSSDEFFEESSDSSSDSSYEKIEPEKNGKSENSTDSDEESSSEDESVESDSSEEIVPVSKKETKKPEPAKSNVDLLLELDDFAPVGQTLLPSFGDSILSPTSNGQSTLSTLPVKIPDQQHFRKIVAPSFVPSAKTEILNKIKGHNELSILARFTRSCHVASPKMVSVELSLTNHDKKEALTNIHWTQKSLDMSIHNSTPIMQLLPGSVTLGALGVDFKDSIQPLALEVSWYCAGMERKSDVTLRVPIGELVQPLSMSEEDFISEQVKLKGMNEHMAKVTLKNVDLEIPKSIFEIANLTRVISEKENTFRFSGQTLSSNCLVLLTITKQETSATVCVNCEKMVVGSVFLNEIKVLLSQ